MKNVIVIILLAVGVFLAIKGIETFQNSSADVEFLGIEISADDKSGQNAGIMYIVLGVIALVGSYFFWKKK
ncbi:MAG: hypothetical protein DHS20C18_09360 [Saprospiraceae bacterium]|nr:MAG: hypothetical protein DHS20C18_09360 [Saprospiraceae bacterium]